MRIEITPFSLSLARPLETARGAIAAREGFLVVVERDGTKGIGEATPLPRWTESLTECERALQRAVDAGEGSERSEPSKSGSSRPSKSGDADLEGALDSLDASETPAARHGLGMALADRRAREATVPLYRHLGGDQEVERVPVNATIGDGSPEETARAARTALDDGFRALKVKVGARTIEADVARIRAIGERVASARNEGEIEVRADANGAWSLSEARAALAAFEGVRDERNGTRGIAYVEQPLSPADLAGHATLREEHSVAIALDESVAEYSTERILDAGAADVVICKPMVLGGLDRTRKIALRAREAGVAPVVTTTIDGAVGRVGATHLAASLAPIDACGLATASLLEVDLVGSDPAPITDGYALVFQDSGALEERLRAEAIVESGA